jgi:RHS repeat-associated protein
VDAIAQYDAGGTPQAQSLFGLGIDLNLSRYSGGARLYYLHDGLNSATNLIDAGQTTQDSYDYDAWGNVIAGAQSQPNNYQFTGREVDSESGLLYYRARTYDPSQGRFLQLDPIDQNEGLSSYVYVDNNPVNFVDASGAFACCASRQKKLPTPAQNRAQLIKVLEAIFDLFIDFVRYNVEHEQHYIGSVDLSYGQNGANTIQSYPNEDQSTI